MTLSSSLTDVFDPGKWVKMAQNNPKMTPNMAPGMYLPFKESFDARLGLISILLLNLGMVVGFG